MEEQVTSVGGDGRDDVAGLAVDERREWLWRSACRQHSKQPGAAGREDDGAIGQPDATRVVRRVADRLRRPAFERQPLQPAIDAVREAELPAVGREERRRHRADQPRRAVDGGQLEAVERAPQSCAALLLFVKNSRWGPSGDRAALRSSVTPGGPEIS